MNSSHRVHVRTQPHENVGKRKNASLGGRKQTLEEKTSKVQKKRLTSRKIPQRHLGALTVTEINIEKRIYIN